MTKADIYRKYGLPESMIRGGGLKAWLRYMNPVEKGVYWYWFSRYIRERDVEQWGTCISCNCPITFDSCQAGHFIPANGCGRDLLFDERNVNAECKRCNGFDEMHLIGYAKNLDKRYGEGTSALLIQRYQDYKDGPVVRDWKAKEYEAKIHALPNYVRTDYSLSR